MKPIPVVSCIAASSVGALRDLIEKRSGIEASCEAARNEVSEARYRLDEAPRCWVMMWR